MARRDFSVNAMALRIPPETPVICLISVMAASTTCEQTSSACSIVKASTIHPVHFQGCAGVVRLDFEIEKA